MTPGHPLFECVRADVLERVEDDLRHGAVFYDLQRSEPACLDVFTAAIRDGRGNILHRRLFVVESGFDGAMKIRQPTLFLDLVPAEKGLTPPDGRSLPARELVEQALVEKALRAFLDEVREQRGKEVETIQNHLEISLNELIHRQNLKMAELFENQQSDVPSPLLAANIKQVEDRLDELNARLERRRAELAQERQCMIGEIQHLGRAWVLPHPDRDKPNIAPMVRDEEIERIAVQAVIAYEEARGWQVESVEKENRGFDLISRRPHPEDPKTALEVRFVEIKGRAAVDMVALSENEYKTAERLKQDYWLYVVYNCATSPEIHLIQDPVRLGWQSVVKIEHYIVGADKILKATK